MKFGVVVIGRNEGERLKRCLKSVPTDAVVVYVDSASTDGSAEWARKQDIEVIELDMSLPFTAARARNTGFRHLSMKPRDPRYVQFVDGDCELSADWPDSAISFLQSHPDVGAVCGRLRERHPEKSIYNWLCDREWNGPTGEVRTCGGIVMTRVEALEAVGGYREDMIGGEDPELCVRLRAAHWRVWRLDCEMALHDAAITRFGQWWQRSIRGGYGFALGAYLHGASPERHYVWESCRAWLWGVCFPLACVVAVLTLGSWGWAVLLIYPLQMTRQMVRNTGPLSQRVTLALFGVLVRFPEGLGQIKFWCEHLLRRQAHLIEYK